MPMLTDSLIRDIKIGLRVLIKEKGFKLYASAEEGK